MFRMSSSRSHESMDLGRYLEVAFEACDGAGKILNNHFGNLRNVDEKYQAGLVSEADRESENFIIDVIRRNFADHSFLGEETGLSEAPEQATGLAQNGVGDRGPASIAGTRPAGGAKEKTTAEANRRALWIIDPLDGTTNYVHQFPVFCISIGLEIDGELVLGVVDAPKLGMRFHAVKGGGAFLNGAPIRVSNRTQIRDGLFATGFSSYDNTLDEQLEMLAMIVKRTRGIRRAGAAALDLCFVAQGVFDVFWEKNLSPWDTAAGVVIAREAGALVTDMRGNEFNPRLKSILCGNPALHGEALKTMRQIQKRHHRG